MNSLNKKLVFPSRIVGRDEETDLLQDLYANKRSGNRQTDRGVYVKGLSGTGKSALVISALKQLVKDDGGFFCHGKFDIARSHRPFSAIVEALNLLCSQAIRKCQSEKEKQELRGRIRTQFAGSGNSLITLMSLLPNLGKLLHGTEQIYRKASSREFTMNDDNSIRATSTKNTHSFFQLKSLLRALIEMLVGKKMFVLFIDDLQVNFTILKSSVIQYFAYSRSFALF